ncbi:hypothetical protein Thermo_01936 [Thermoplasmatales archaeon]|nr:hypothetical protein Thermo_01936 [Thermoplasmatales archaeon]
MFRKNVETENNYMREKICEIARQYGSDRFDGALIAIGNAGERVLKKLMPLEEARVFYHAVNHGRNTVDSERNSGSDAVYMEIYSNRPMEVKLVNVGDDGFGDLNFSAGKYTGAQFETTVSDISDSQAERAKTALKIYAGLERADSYILLSAFGGKYSQKMHTALARVFIKRGVANLSVVIKPSRLYPHERALAEAGIRDIRNLGAKVKVIDNDLFEANVAGNFTRYSSENQWPTINTKIAREVEVYLMRLSAASADARKLVAS